MCNPLREDNDQCEPETPEHCTDYVCLEDTSACSEIEHHPEFSFKCGTGLFVCGTAEDMAAGLVEGTGEVSYNEATQTGCNEGSATLQTITAAQCAALIECIDNIAGKTKSWTLLASPA